jgi:peptidoglycan/xylan/chitin deacetylase (PgdA/CDA1 family)
MGLCITNDFLHKYVLKAILPVALHDRYIVEGASTEERIVCISFDCDVDEDMERVPSLLDVLRDEKIHTSFAIVGNLANKYPIIVKEILEKGHEIVNHSFSHPKNFGSIGSTKMKEEIGSFQTFMISNFDYKPEGFRAPHLMRKYSRTLFHILKEEELYDSSYVGHGILKIDDVVELALTSCPEHHQVCFDHWHHFQLPLLKSSFNKFLNLWELLLNEEHLINVFLDPSRISDVFLKEMIRRVSKDFKLLRLKDVAKRFTRI